MTQGARLADLVVQLKAAAEDVPADGAPFTIIQVEGEEWDLVWFGSAATVTNEVPAEVAPLKREIIRLFLGRHAQSQQLAEQEPAPCHPDASVGEPRIRS